MLRATALDDPQRATLTLPLFQQNRSVLADHRAPTHWENGCCRNPVGRQGHGKDWKTVGKHHTKAL